MQHARLSRLQKIAGPVDEALVARLPLKYAQVIADGCAGEGAAQVSSERAEAARGYCLGLGALPGELLAAASDRAIDVLIVATRRVMGDAGAEAAGQDAELRRNAVDGLGGVCAALHAVGALAAEQMQRAFDAVMGAFGDYAMDNRGDVGSWVRESAMSVGAALVRLQLQQSSASGASELESMCAQIFPVLVKQAVEKIDRLRGHAGTILQSLLHNDPPLPGIPDAEAILAAVPAGTVMNWQSSKDSFPPLVGLLATEAYHYPVLSGLVVSVGGLTESLLKHGRDELMTQLEEAEDPVSKHAFGEIWGKIAFFWNSFLVAFTVAGSPKARGKRAEKPKSHIFRGRKNGRKKGRKVDFGQKLDFDPGAHFAFRRLWCRGWRSHCSAYCARAAMRREW